MKTRLLALWQRLRYSFWFLPAVMAASAAALAFAGVALDENLNSQWLLAHPWAYTGGAEGATAMLGVIASSMITIAGVVFSLTLVALSLASSQFGPRLLRNFMRDTTTQLMLGTFVSTFLYCLLVMRTIRRAEEALFVPHLSVSLGVVFALASVAVLIYFIHHVAVSIQANAIIAKVHAELLERIERLFPQDINEPAWGTAAAHPSDILTDFERDPQYVCADDDGYLQLIDPDALLSAATEHDTRVKILARPGRYLIAGEPLVAVVPLPGDEAFVARIRAAFVLGEQRTSEQDVLFVVEQLVEMAVRALSPGINDPFTACSCVDRLASALCRFARRRLPDANRIDTAGALRVIAPGVVFAELLDAAFAPIRQHARTSVAVTQRLLEACIRIAPHIHRPEDLVALRQQAEAIARNAQAWPEAKDRESVAALNVEGLASCRLPNA
ncbi:MAG: DUF2254 domain-containing protein [Steroidobacteraceae bacterium]